MTKPFRPMLASPAEVSSLRFPVLASPKLDGFRVLAMDGKPMTRSMKLVPNRHVQRVFSEWGDVLEGLDGELIVGEPTAKDVFEQTTSQLRREEGEPEFTFHVFDLWNRDGVYYRDRLAELQDRKLSKRLMPWIRVVPHVPLADARQLEVFETKLLEQGYEGVMLRCPLGPYKQGRSSAREGWLLKVKRYEDAEAVVIDFEEEMHNANEAFTSEIGRTKRSTAQEGLIGKGRLGALVVKGVNGPFKDASFNIGTGFDAAQRTAFWADRANLKGQVVTYKYFSVGAKDAPRHPVFKGFREAFDLIDAA
jgi:DNA ligase 1